MRGRRLTTAVCVLGLMLLTSGCQDKPAEPQEKPAPPKATSYGSKPNLSKAKDRTIRIDPDNPAVSGCLGRDILLRVIRSHLQEVQDCYRVALGRQEGLAGKIQVKFTVVHDGSVSQANVVKSTLNDAQMEKCLTDRILTWKFPDYKGGPECVVNYPFTFNKSS